MGLDLRANEYNDKSIYRVDQKVGGGPSATYPKAGDTKSESKTDENVYALYGEYKQKISEKVSATANLRYDLIKLDSIDYKNNQHDKDFKVYSYRIGFDYQLTDKTTIFTNFSTGFRAPTVSQLFAGDNTSAFDPVLSNLNLKPEHANNYEIGLRTSYNDIGYEASIFQIDRKDFIMKTSGNYGVTDTTYMWDNIGGARHRGLEFAMNGNVTEKLSFNLAYTYLDAVYTKYDNFGIDLDGNPMTSNVTAFNVTGNTIPRTSKHQINLITDYQATKSLKFMAEVNAKSSYYADDLNRLKMDARTILNLGVDYSTKVDNYPLSLFARIDNVFDNQYYNTARASSDRNSDGVFDYEDLSITVNPGTVFTAGASVKF